MRLNRSTGGGGLTARVVCWWLKLKRQQKIYSKAAR